MGESLTRLENIKERHDTFDVQYFYPGSGRYFGEADADMQWLIARNEELQRRVKRLESALGAIKEEAAAFASDERDLGYIFIGIYTTATNVLDAKDQDDD